MPRGVRTSPAVVAAISLLSREGLSATEMSRELHHYVAADEVPDLRVIQRWAGEARAGTSDDQWNFDSEEFQPHEAGLLLDVVGKLTEITEGRKSTLRLGEARMISRLAQAFEPPRYVLLPYELYMLGSEYLIRRERGADVGGLDLYLSFRRAFPRHGNWRDRYRRALDQHWAFSPPLWWGLTESERVLGKMQQTRRIMDEEEGQ